MPNWCSNSLFVSGTPEQIEQFVEQMKAVNKKEGEKEISALDFEAVVPMPRVLLDRKSPADDSSITWYDWSLDNWGTKWNTGEAYVEYETGSTTASYNYETAWGPAMNWQEKVIEYFPWLTFEFEWEEPNMNFCGSMSGASGKVTEVLEGEISEARYEEIFGHE